MTAPATAKKTTPAKETTPIDESVPTPEVVPDDTPVDRIPEELADQTILADFCQRYLNSYDEILAYNKQVLAEKDAEWNPTKLVAKAREMANPEDASKAVPAIKKLVDEFEKALTAFNVARRAVIDGTAKELGVSLSSTSERDPEVEEALKKKRTEAKVIGTNLSTIAEMAKPEAKDVIIKFLSEYPLPTIGRDQAHNFGSGNTGSTPKYRVHVSVTNKDGKEIVSEDGFTKASQALPKYYERGKSPKSDTLREIWEKAGNSPKEPYKVSPVEWNDNGLKFILSKKS